ncbi:unnamed protein product [Symbiodinium sp. CCMP2592]|nr:unnamed protein product [Symbiodinium sp. CCMP2592]
MTSTFDARDMSWVDQLPDKLDALKAFRRRSQEGKSLARGLHQPGHGDKEVVLPTLDCCKMNSELLAIPLKLMADNACIFVPPVYLLQGACLEFHSEAGFPDAAALQVAGNSDGWAMKRLLNVLKRKWNRPETPRDTTVRALTDEFQRAYDNLEYVPQSKVFV